MAGKKAKDIRKKGNRLAQALKALHIQTRIQTGKSQLISIFFFLFVKHYNNLPNLTPSNDELEKCCHK